MSLPRFSQSNEDRIIHGIFADIGIRTKNFVEFGCGPGNQNNSIRLLKAGWSGIWIEPRKKRFHSARRLFSEYPVKVIRRWVTPQNVNRYVVDPLDFLSIDIDGNDYAVWEAVTAKPRVVCIEYWAAGGSPFEAIKCLGESKGYELFGRSKSDVNAFFVRR